MPVSGSYIMSVQDSVQANIEKVRKKAQVYFESTSEIVGEIEKQGEVEKDLTRKLYRIPVMLFRGGQLQKFNADGGDMGSGSGMKIDKLTAGYIESTYVVEVSLETLQTTSKPGQSVVDPFAKLLAEHMQEIKALDDITFHTDGSSKLTNPSNAYASAGWASGDTYTFAGTVGTPDYLKANLLRPGMSVSVWNSSGTTRRTVTPNGGSSSATGALQIDHIDPNAFIVYLTGTVTGGTAGDILCFGNLVDTANAQSFQSSWPLSGDTYRHGYRYFNDATASNYYLGQQKSNMPQLLPARINAANSPLTFSHVQLGLDAIFNTRDADVVNGLMGIAHMAQRSQLFDIGVTITNKLISGTSFGKSLDLQPSNNGYGDNGKFEMCGIPCRVSKRADRSRFDFIVPKNCFRSMAADTDFHRVGKDYIFESRMPSGNLKAAQHFIIVQAYDFGCYDPGAGIVIDTLAVKSGY